MTDSTPAKQLASFIDKFDPKMATLIRGARSAMRKRLPTALELVYDNYNFFVIGYGPTERASDCMLSLAAAANGISLCFLRGATLPDPEKLLLGAGKQTRFVRLASPATLSEPGVEALIAAALKQSRVAMPASGKGRTIIKSISAKQRPRRATS